QDSQAPLQAQGADRQTDRRQQGASETRRTRRHGAESSPQPEARHAPRRLRRARLLHARLPARTPDARSRARRRGGAPLPRPRQAPAPAQLGARLPDRRPTLAANRRLANVRYHRRSQTPPAEADAEAIPYRPPGRATKDPAVHGPADRL